MKRPSYQLTAVFKSGETEFPIGTLVQPIDDVHVPSHQKEILENERKYNTDEWIMCIIGIKWYPVRKKIIKEIR